MVSLSVFYVVKVITFFIGLAGCFLLHHECALPVVVSAALVGFLSSLLPYTVKFQGHPQASIYCGAFAGMCSQSIIQSTLELVVVSVIGALIYTLLRNMFSGIGGKLGAIAFTAVGSVVLAKGMLG